MVGNLVNSRLVSVPKSTCLPQLLGCSVDSGVVVVEIGSDEGQLLH